VDPRREHARQPPGEPIPGSRLVEYRTVRDEAARQMSTLLLAQAAPPADAVRAKQ
jgi:hypothetical protein